MPIIASIGIYKRTCELGCMPRIFLIIASLAYGCAFLYPIDGDGAAEIQYNISILYLTLELAIAPMMIYVAIKCRHEKYSIDMGDICLCFMLTIIVARACLSGSISFFDDVHILLISYSFYVLVKSKWLTDDSIYGCLFAVGIIYSLDGLLRMFNINIFGYASEGFSDFVLTREDLSIVLAVSLLFAINRLFVERTSDRLLNALAFTCFVMTVIALPSFVTLISTVFVLATIFVLLLCHFAIKRIITSNVGFLVLVVCILGTLTILDWVVFGFANFGVIADSDFGFKWGNSDVSFNTIVIHQMQNNVLEDEIGLGSLLIAKAILNHGALLTLIGLVFFFWLIVRLLNGINRERVLMVGSFALLSTHILCYAPETLPYLTLPYVFAANKSKMIRVSGQNFRVRHCVAVLVVIIFGAFFFETYRLNGLALWREAKYYSKYSRFDISDKYYRKAAGFPVNRPELFYDYAENSFNSGKYEEAISILLAHNLGLYNYEATLLLGLSYEAINLNDKAINEFKGASILYPDKYYPKYLLQRSKSDE